MKIPPIPDKITVEPNKFIVAALKHLKTRLWDGKSDRKHYQEWAICLGIQLPKEHKDIFNAYVAKALNHYAFYAGWLAHQPERDGNLAAVCNEYIQAGRLRWIDQMIEDFGGSP